MLLTTLVFAGLIPFPRVGRGGEFVWRETGILNIILKTFEA